MNSVKWKIYEQLKEQYPTLTVHLTNGVLTKRTRKDRNIMKSHSNDAYCRGCFYPSHRSNTLYYKKKRRNNRLLSIFYDAKIIDIRNGEVKTGKELSCNRTKRNMPRHNEENLRVFRGQKVKSGYFSIRRTRYEFQPNDIVLFDNRKYKVVGTHCNGLRVLIAINNKNKSVAINKLRKVVNAGGWICIEK